MSSKKAHTVAGWVTGACIAYVSHSDAIHSFLFLLGAHLGASAPDWMEIVKWRTTRHWFRANESHRLSLIPHRTLTHVLSLWLVVTFFSAHLVMTRPTYMHLVGLAFCLSALTHLALDIRTPMGIPLLPFGKRYRLIGFKLAPARKIQDRSGW